MKISLLHESAVDCSFEKELEEATTKIKHIYNKTRPHKVLYFDNPSYVSGRMSIVSRKEGEGPIGKYFDKIQNDAKYGQKNFELAEINFLQESIWGAIQSANLKISDIDLMLSGDLLNQLTTSNYVARNLGLPFLGVYSACSSMSQALLMGAVMIDGGHANNVVCGVSSHFASAERQFRMPLEYGGQKPPYSQWTVTGAGSTVLSSKDNGGIRIVKGLMGTVVDMGTHDIANMGAAMAPAFLHSLVSFFNETGTNIDDYDLVVSGDLGKLGSDIARTIALEEGIRLGHKYIDCGAIMYNNYQNAYQGGSGCACSATVINGYILPQMLDKKYKKVLYLATGALMSPQSTYQGESIPCISHGVLFEI
ncbi:MAG: stage V sporulation protein AD [Firmicutes bacterium]|nr:stage V sporulation protein AD [Bacillota bacterium]MCL1953287.1 stage V sporulation protein AD [Bacillota bacterium]